MTPPQGGSEEERGLPVPDGASIWSDFLALCDFGGRLAGSESEARATAWAHEQLRAVPGGIVQEAVSSYAGWCSRAVGLRRLDDDLPLACVPLLGSASTRPGGLVAEVVDLGPGRADDFARHREDIPGRIVLVRHEYPFSTDHLHRRVKLGMAQEAGAAGFLIAHPEMGVGPVSGSSGRGAGAGIPALGVDAEAMAALVPHGRQWRVVRMVVDGEDLQAEARTLVLDLPGQGPDRIVLSAHLDGHPMGESAIDNATGVAVALGVARTLAPSVASCSRGLRVCLFGAEEWGLVGSRLWLADLSPPERERMLLDINLDSLGGAPHLTALTSDLPRLDDWVRDQAERAGLPLNTHLPMMRNSDHANFVEAGIPGFRLVAGFGDPDSHLRLLLTARDTRALVRRDEIDAAANLALVLAWEALRETDARLRELKRV